MLELLNAELPATSKKEKKSKWGDRMINKVEEGEKRARALMLKVIKGEKVDRKKLTFNEDLIKRVHKEILYYYPGWAGEYRDHDDLEIGDRKPEPYKNIPFIMRKLGVWLEDQIQEIDRNDADLHKGLNIIAGLHFGLVYVLQPFNDGNKATARLISNGVLILGSAEFRLNKDFAVPPIPTLNSLITTPLTELSHQISFSQLKQQMALGKDIKADPYGRSLEKAAETESLNPIELHLANMWMGSLQRRLSKIYTQLGPDGKSPAEARLIRIFEERLMKLKAFQLEQESGRAEIHPIPDFLYARYF